MARGVEACQAQVAAIVADLSGPADQPEETAGPGGRPDEAATERVVAAAGGVPWRRGECNEKAHGPLTRGPRCGNAGRPLQVPGAFVVLFGVVFVSSCGRVRADTSVHFQRQPRVNLRPRIMESRRTGGSASSRHSVFSVSLLRRRNRLVIGSRAG